jgi:hypothetical protein
MWNRRNKSVRRLKKIMIFRMSRETPAVTLPLLARGASTQRMPNPSKKKFTPMKTPPRRSAFSSINLLRPRVSAVTRSINPCQSSMRTMVAVPSGCFIRWLGTDRVTYFGDAEVRIARRHRLQNGQKTPLQLQHNCSWLRNSVRFSFGSEVSRCSQRR